MRTIVKIYQDPLDVIWIETARALGIEIERDPTVFASWDGSRVLRIGTPETLDADDSLAQMIFHELCHLLVEGPDAMCLPDWGLGNDPVHEHACLRVQAALADTVGLRAFFAATTMFRKYCDGLPNEPLADDGDPAVGLALAAWKRSREEPWSGALDRALRMTADIAQIVQDVAPRESLWVSGP